MTLAAARGSVVRDCARRLRSLAAALLAGLALAGCNQLMTAGGPPDAAIGAGPQTVPAATGAGAEEHARIVAAYGGIYHDDRLEQTVARIVGRIVAASEQPEQPYRITILNSPAVNAFALPGGYLYVTRGLLALASDSSEVAAVLAHEMGHVIANHAIAAPEQGAERGDRQPRRHRRARRRGPAGAGLEPALARELLPPAGARGRRHGRQDHRPRRLRSLRRVPVPDARWRNTPPTRRPRR